MSRMRSEVRRSARPQDERVASRSVVAGERLPAAIPSSRVADVVGTSGERLGERTRAAMEHRFGRDFSRVRVHADGRAARSAAELGARAYTVGSHVVFGRGGVEPGVLAHELVHVVQQAGAAASLPNHLPVDPASDAEHQAQASALGTATRTPVAVALSVQRQALPDEASAAHETSGPLAASGGDDARTLVDVMSSVEGLRRDGPDAFATDYQGRRVTMNAAQRDRLVGQATMTLQHNLRRIRDQADNARGGYADQEEANHDSRAVSFVVTTLAGVRGNPERLLIAAARAERQVASAEVALASGRFVLAASRMSAAEAQAQTAERLYREYHSGILDAGEKTITVLEHTRNASFVTLGVLSIIATGGAAAAAAGSAGATTTAFTFEVGTVAAANTIAFGAPIVATGSTALARVALGEKVDWGSVGVELAVNVVLSKFGGKLSQAFFARMVGNAAVAGIGKLAAGRILSSLLTHEYATAFSTVVEQVYQQLRHGNVTWDQFTDRVVERITDPGGYLVAGLMGAVQAGAEAKLGGARRIEIVDDLRKPVGEIDAIRGGVVREDKSAEGLNRTNPKTGRAYPGSDEATWAQKQIWGKTVARIEALGTAAGSRPAVESGVPVGSRTFPSIADLRTVRRYAFDIEADSPALRAQVAIQLAALRARYPDWNFSARFGVR